MPEPPVNDKSAQDAPGDAALGPTVILPASTESTAAAASTTATQAAPPALASPGSAPAGWFGKLPMLGDFASRRLPDAFIKPWDDWLQPSLAAAKESIGERWLDLYLTFPVWRFAIPAGLVGDGCWIGVFLPSVDKVGRCFPLTICEGVSRKTLEDAGLAGIDAHLCKLAEAGIEALDANAIDSLEQRLAALAPLQTGPAGASDAAIALEAWLPRRQQSQSGQSGQAQDRSAVAWPLGAPIPAALSAAASRFVIATLGNRVLWWSPAAAADGEGSPHGALRLEPYPFSGGLLGNLIGTD